MKRPMLFGLLVKILAAFALSNISDTSASVTNTVLPDNDNKSNSSQSNADKSSALLQVRLRCILCQRKSGDK